MWMSPDSGEEAEQEALASETYRVKKGNTDDSIWMQGIPKHADPIVRFVLSDVGYVSPFSPPMSMSISYGSDYRANRLSSYRVHGPMASSYHAQEIEYPT